jgi:serine/threonine protein kinase
VQQLKSKTLVDHRFEIIEILGVGGMGIVYKGDQVGLNRVVALKLLQPYLLQEDESLARFEREAQALSALSHRNIILFYAYGMWQDRAPYIAMEYMDTPDLAELLIAEGGSFSWRRSLDIAAQLCNGLAHAHQAGIIHRDLKPSNIFVIRDGTSDLVKITDFGLAKFADESVGGGSVQKLTATGVMVGTPHYMSPEQITGGPVTAASDVYAVGCILYQCLFGRVPFDGDNIMELFAQHIHAECPLPKPGELKALPAGIIQLLKTALAKDPANRFQSMEEMLAAISKIQMQSSDGRDSVVKFSPTKLSLAGKRLDRAAQWMIPIAVAAICIIGYAFRIPVLNSLFDHRLQVARAQGDPFEASQISLEQVQLAKQLHSSGMRQDALNSLSHDLAAAVRTKSFKDQDLRNKRAFLSSCLVAFGDWQPSPPILYGQIEHLDADSFLSNQGLHEESELSVGLSLLFAKGIGRHSERNSRALPLLQAWYAMAILKGGPHSPYRQTLIEWFERSLDRSADHHRQSASITPNVVSGLASDCEAAAAKKNHDLAFESFQSIFWNFALYDQSPASRVALRRAATAFGSVTNDHNELTILSRCYRCLWYYDQDEELRQSVLKNEFAMLRAGDAPNYELVQMSLSNVDEYREAIRLVYDKHFADGDGARPYIHNWELALCELLESQHKPADALAGYKKLCAETVQIPNQDNRWWYDRHFNHLASYKINQMTGANQQINAYPSTEPEYSQAFTLTAAPAMRWLEKCRSQYEQKGQVWTDYRILNAIIAMRQGDLIEAQRQLTLVENFGCLPLYDPLTCRFLKERARLQIAKGDKSSGKKLLAESSRQRTLSNKIYPANANSPDYADAVALAHKCAADVPSD